MGAIEILDLVPAKLDQRLEIGKLNCRQFLKIYLRCGLVPRRSLVPNIPDASAVMFQGQIGIPYAGIHCGA